jgi:hypothetical protein
MVKSWYPRVQDIFLIVSISGGHQWNYGIYTTLSAPEKRSTSGAAERLHIAQSALSLLRDYLHCAFPRISLSLDDRKAY